MYIKGWPLLMLLMTYKSTVYTPDRLPEVYQETIETWDFKEENNNFEYNIIINMTIDTNNNTAHQNKQKSN